MDAINIVLPFVATLAGAGVTYWLNVRQRRSNYVEDLFYVAIVAVFAADASTHFTGGPVARPLFFNNDEHTELNKLFITEGLKNWRLKMADANEAFARVVPFEATESSIIDPNLIDLLRLGTKANRRRCRRDAHF